jgi:hypothetical protein
VDVVRARWSSSSFLVYAGAFVVLASAIGLLSTLSDDYSEGALFGWSALVLGVAAAAAAAFEARGQELAAGLFAFVTVGVFAVFAGSFLDLIGLLDEGPFEGFDIGTLLLYLVTMIAALVLLGRFHFPLLVLVAAVAGWFFVVDLVSNGGNWTAIVAIFVGLCYLLAGAVADRWYGFWLHMVAGLSIGGGFLYLWHDADWEWILIGLIALLYLLMAGGLERSSYAVLGAIGLFLAWSHFVEEWTDEAAPNPLFGTGDIGNSVAQVLLYAVYGLALVLIGLWLERRRPADPVAPSSETA